MISLLQKKNFGPNVRFLLRGKLSHSTSREGLTITKEEKTACKHDRRQSPDCVTPGVLPRILKRFAFGERSSKGTLFTGRVRTVSRVGSSGASGVFALGVRPPLTGVIAVGRRVRSL